MGRDKGGKRSGNVGKRVKMGRSGREKVGKKSRKAREAW